MQKRLNPEVKPDPIVQGAASRAPRIVGDPLAHLGGCLGPHALVIHKPRVEAPTLSGTFAQRRGFNADPGRSSFHLGAKGLGKGHLFHDQNHNVKDHTLQVETSHLGKCRFRHTKRP